MTGFLTMESLLQMGEVSLLKNSNRQQ